jgi:hypothetical protein
MVRRWLQALTWPPLIAISACGLVLMAAGLWSTFGTTTLTVPSSDRTTAELRVDCPQLFGGFIVSSRAAKRRQRELSQGLSTAEIEAQRSARCGDLARDHARLGGIGIAVSLAGAAASVLLVGKGPRVVVDRRRLSAGWTSAFGGVPSAQTCGLCGRPSPARKASLMDFSGSPARCGPCVEARHVHAIAFTWAVTVVLVSAGITILLAGVVDIALIPLALGLSVTLFLAQVPPHELGHALVARLLGLRVTNVTLGVGRPVAKFDVGRTKVVLRLLPAGGSTMMLDCSRPGYRTRVWLAVAAGPAVAAATMALAVSWDADTSVSTLLRSLVLLTTGVLLLLNLVPQAAPHADGAVPNDGSRLVRIPFMPAADVADHVLHNRTLVALLDAARDGTRPVMSVEDRALLDQRADAGDVTSRLARADLLMAANEWDGAADAFRALLPEIPVHADSYAVLLNIVAWCSVMVGDLPPGGEADMASAEAQDLRPESAAGQGTRGSVLVAIGRPAEGLPLLRASMAGPLDDASLALTYCYLAIGEAALGNQDRAVSDLDLARDHDPACPLLPRAVEHVRAADLLAPPVGDRSGQVAGSTP